MVQQIVSKMDVDWEAPLVDALGDVMGHQLAQALRAMFRWSESARASLKRQLSEYLLEEGKLTPPKAELEHFYDSVQSLSMRVERAQSQLAKLLAPQSDSPAVSRMQGSKQLPMLSLRES